MPRRYNSKKSKRWYVDATIGKSVPFVGGSGIRFGSGTGKLAKRSLDSHIKQVVRKSVLEPKKHYTGDVASPTALHNTMYTYNFTKDITQGTGDNQRESDYINVNKVHLNLHLQGPSGGTTTKIAYRVMLVKTRQNSTTAGIISAHFGSSVMFYPGSSDLLLAHWDPRLTTVLHDKIHTITPQVATQITSTRTELTFSPGKFVYDEGNQVGKFYNYYLVVIPYLERGTTGVTAVGDFKINVITNFTDGK